MLVFFRSYTIIKLKVNNFNKTKFDFYAVHFLKLPRFFLFIMLAVNLATIFVYILVSKFGLKFTISCF